MTHDEVMGRYLQRLGHSARPTPSLAALRDLVSRHLQTVPFENLDIVNGLPPDCSTAGFLHKVVIRRRGGFCYELNEAFGALLTHLGFDSRRIEARVWAADRRQFGAPFDHLALVVSLPEGDFLTDVGFGDSNRTPMRLPADAVTDISGPYTLAQATDALWLLSRAERPLYEMTLDGQPLSAFAPMYGYHRTSPESLFARGLICTRATPAGRITLSRDRLIIVEGANRTETVIANRDHALKEYFDLEGE